MALGRIKINQRLADMMLSYKQQLGPNDNWEIPGLPDINIYVFDSGANQPAIYISGSNTYCVYGIDDGIQKIQELIQQKYF